MNIEITIKELLALRDEAICTDEHCNCNRFDDIIYALKAQRKAIWDWLTMMADPKHSDSEGLDLVIELFEDNMGLSIDDAAKELSE